MRPITVGMKPFSPALMKAMKRSPNRGPEVALSKAVVKELAKQFVEATASGKYEQFFDKVITPSPTRIRERIVSFLDRPTEEPLYLSALVDYGVSQMKKAGSLEHELWTGATAVHKVVAKRAPRKGDTVHLYYGDWFITAKVGSSEGFKVRARSTQHVASKPQGLTEMQRIENGYAAAAAMVQGRMNNWGRPR
mgnify:CR=1 FL=1